MDRVERALKKKGYDVVEKKRWKLLVKSKEDKLFLVKQIKKDKHVSYIHFLFQVILFLHTVYTHGIIYIHNKCNHVKYVH